MIQFEYCFEKVPLSEEQKSIIDSGFQSLPPEGIEKLFQEITKIANQKGKQSWELVFPFALPFVWFKKTKGVK